MVLNFWLSSFPLILKILEKIGDVLIRLSDSVESVRIEAIVKKNDRI